MQHSIVTTTITNSLL